MNAAPNPFNPRTTIYYSLPEQARVTIEIFDLSGRRIRQLVGGVRRAGEHAATWNGTNGAGKPVASGVYFYRLDAGGQTAVRKMVLAR